MLPRERPVPGPGRPGHAAEHVSRSSTRPPARSRSSVPQLALATLAGDHPGAGRLPLLPTLPGRRHARRRHQGLTPAPRPLTAHRAPPPRPATRAWGAAMPNGDPPMHPVITASVPLLEPPGWAHRAARAVRPARPRLAPLRARLHRPGRAAAATTAGSPPATVWTTSTRSFFNWPQLYLLGGADDLLRRGRAALGGRHPAAHRAGHAPRRVRARLRLVPPGREPAAALLPVHGRPRTVDASGRCASPSSTSTRRTATTTPSTASSAARTTAATRGRRGPVRRRRLPLAAARKPGCTASRWTGCCRPAPPSPPRDRDPRLGEEMRAPDGHRRHRGQPGRVRAGPQRPDPLRRAALPGLDRRVRRRVAGARRRQRRHPPGQRRARTAPSAGLLEGRWYGGHYGWSWPHGWYSVGHAAIVAALAGAAATGDDSFLDLVRPALDEIIAHGKVMAFTEADSSIQSKWVAQLGEDVRHADPARARSATATRAGSTTTRC